MIGLKQQTLFWHSLNVSVITPISDQFGGGWKQLSFLCSPEDTTDNIGRRQVMRSSSKAMGLRHVLKGLFWVIVSIAFSVAVGQLH